MSVRHARLLEHELVLQRKWLPALIWNLIALTSTEMHSVLCPQIIGIPESVGEACLLVGEENLSPTQVSNCTNILDRAFGTFGRNVNGLGFLTGANTLDVAKIGIDSGLLTSNGTLIADGYQRIHNEVVVQNATKADGIRADGSFGQHGGIIYNGNYGKD